MTQMDAHTVAVTQAISCLALVSRSVLPSDGLLLSPAAPPCDLQVHILMTQMDAHTVAVSQALSCSPTLVQCCALLFYASTLLPPGTFPNDAGRIFRVLLLSVLSVLPGRPSCPSLSFCVLLLRTLLDLQVHTNNDALAIGQPKFWVKITMEHGKQSINYHRSSNFDHIDGDHEHADDDDDHVMCRGRRDKHDHDDDDDEHVMVTMIM